MLTFWKDARTLAFTNLVRFNFNNTKLRSKIMATNPIAFFDQMNGVNYQTLSSTNYKLGIVDPDSSGLTSTHLSSLESSGKSTVGYLSIGEAETYRD